MQWDLFFQAAVRIAGSVWSECFGFSRNLGFGFEGCSLFLGIGLEALYDCFGEAEGGSLYGCVAF